MILFIDNYDSFTYNLVQYVGEMGKEVMVFRNDCVTPADVEKTRPSHIIISPGPGTPDDAGVSKEVIRTFAGKIPVLGVCLGHQCIAEVYGAKVVRAEHIMHGKVSDIYHTGEGIFGGIPSPFTATRYHSLLVAPDTLKPPLEIRAWTREREIMGIKHKDLDLWGVQFHPESILTVEGKKLLRNFIDIQGDP